MTRPPARRVPTETSSSTPRARTWWPASARPCRCRRWRTGSREVYRELHDIFARLERHYRDMLDTEFTIEQGKLWMLQTRVGKRTGRAALRMAVDMTSRSRHPVDPNRGRVAGQARERRPGAAPRVRRRRPQRSGHRSGRLAGRGSRTGVLRLRRRGGRGGTWGAGRPRAHRDLTRRCRRHAAVRGRGHQPGWSREPRRGGGSRRGGSRSWWARPTSRSSATGSRRRHNCARG